MPASGTRLPTPSRVFAASRPRAEGSLRSIALYGYRGRSPERRKAPLSPGRCPPPYATDHEEAQAGPRRMPGEVARRSVGASQADVDRPEDQLLPAEAEPWPRSSLAELCEQGRSTLLAPLDPQGSPTDPRRLLQARRQARRLHSPSVDERTERYAQALRTAAQVLGSRAQLARFLGINDEQLGRWMAGVEIAPLWAFVQTLELIADGPYATQQGTSVAGVRDVSATRRA